MKTAAEIILEIRELPPEERGKIVDYLNSGEEEFLEDNFSPEEIAEIIQAGKEADQRINVSPVLIGEEANIYLRNLIKRGE